MIELFNVLTRKYKTPAMAARDVVLTYNTTWPVADSDLHLGSTAIEATIEQQLLVRSRWSTLFNAELLQLNHGKS